MKRVGIHIFRRDLRLEDNTALNALAQVVDVIIPVFIFDDRQTTDHPYKSRPGLQMLCESLIDLNDELIKKGAELHVRKGIAEHVVSDLLSELRPVAVSYNKDYTPFALARDQEIDALCAVRSVMVHAEHDVTLHPPGSVTAQNGAPYSVYTRYRVAIEQLPIPVPTPLVSRAKFGVHAGGVNLVDIVHTLLPEPRTLRVSGGRTVAKKMLMRLSENRAYANERDIPSVSGTSLLSAHIKFGTLSIREIYEFARARMPNPATFLRELLWHDFFTTVAALAPHVYTGAFKKQYDGIVWNTDIVAFEKWKMGKTGFPIVDAGMCELAQTGYMHNRVRMIVASFLIKDLHISWQWGEKYFAQMLTDYDPAVNNGNWQWVAGTGCDASPWFRIFNPWLQQKKFDTDCVYIKKWVPELAQLSSADIHEEYSEQRLVAGYPEPLCSHRAEAEITKKMFQAL